LNFTTTVDLALIYFRDSPRPIFFVGKLRISFFPISPSLFFRETFALLAAAVVRSVARFFFFGVLFLFFFEFPLLAEGAGIMNARDYMRDRWVIFSFMNSREFLLRLPSIPFFSLRVLSVLP